MSSGKVIRVINSHFNPQARNNYDPPVREMFTIPGR